MSNRDSKKSSKRAEMIVGLIALLTVVIGAAIKFFPGSTSAASAVTASGIGSMAVSIPGSVAHDVIINPGPKAADPSSKEGAIEQLEKWHQPYTVAGFQAAAESGTPEAVQTYLRAGMSPDSIGDGGLFVLATGIANNPNAASIVDLFRTFHVDFGAKGGVRSALLSDGRLDTEAFYYASFNGKADVVSRLVAGGADPSPLLATMRTECREAVDNPLTRARIKSQLETLQHGGVRADWSCN
ncbi:hypothetical protein [Caballeronia sp. M23-90]